MDTEDVAAARLYPKEGAANRFLAGVAELRMSEPTPRAGEGTH